MTDRSGSNDRVIRAMTDDGAFRVIAAVTTDTARAAVAAQGTQEAAAVRLAELLTGAVLVRETTVPGRRVQIVTRDPRFGTIVADSRPDGKCRGMVNPSGIRDDAHAPALQVSYSLRDGSLHQGIVALPPDDGGGAGSVSTALMRYMQDSEQIVSTIAVGAIDTTAGVSSAGYVVQLLPEAERDALAHMTARLDQLDALADVLRAGPPSAADLVQRILGDLEFSQLADAALAYGCTCSRERVLTGIAGVGDAEVRDMIAAGEPLEVKCDACGAAYEIAVAELAELVESN